MLTKNTPSDILFKHWMKEVREAIGNTHIIYKDCNFLHHESQTDLLELLVQYFSIVFSFPDDNIKWNEHQNIEIVLANIQ